MLKLPKEYLSYKLSLALNISYSIYSSDYNNKLLSDFLRILKPSYEDFKSIELNKYYNTSKKYNSFKHPIINEINENLITELFHNLNNNKFSSYKQLTYYYNSETNSNYSYLTIHRFAK